MAQYIANYIETPGIEKDAINPAVPPAVLAHIQSVVCIRARGEGNRDTQFSGFIFDTD
jgi:hypothetical protein